MALEIVYSEVSKDFRVTEDGRLFRLIKKTNQFGKKGDWREVFIKVNTCAGYCRIRWRGKMYQTHRLMYCLYHKTDVDVDLFIDHKDGNKLNNSKENLRLVSSRGNNQNRIEHRNGLLQGCRLRKCGKWEARIHINGKNISLGSYDTEQKAHEAYLTACTMLDKSIEEIKEFFGIRTKDKCTSKFVGVSFNNRVNKWFARTTINSKTKHLGYFKTEEEAYQAICQYRN